MKSAALFFASLLACGPAAAQVAPVAPAFTSKVSPAPELGEASANLGAAAFDGDAVRQDSLVAAEAGAPLESLSPLSAAEFPVRVEPGRKLSLQPSPPPLRGGGKQGKQESLARPIRRAFELAARAMGAWGLGAAMLASSLVVLTDAACSPAPPVVDQTWTHPDGTISVQVHADPFSLTITDKSGKVLLESSPPHQGYDDGDPVRAYAPLGITHSEDISPPPLLQGWDNYVGLDDPWTLSTHVTGFENQGAALVAHVATDSGGTLTLRVEPQGPGVHLTATDDGAPADGVNRVSLGFTLHGDDHFMGMGERFVYADHRGQKMTNWVEEDGLGLGSNTPIGPANPFPNGPSQSHIPIPWFMSPRGFGMLVNGTFRSVHHFGDETPDAWRVESWTKLLDATLFADPDPTKLVEDLTGVTGRPPAVADFVIAPRRRADSFDEALKLRANHIATSVLDLDTHYFPDGGGTDSAAMRALTAQAHQKGFKAVAYFNAFVRDDWHPVFENAAAAGYLVKQANGRPYVVSVPPYHAAMVDFTNPAATAWYQGWLQKALDDGWDGWMYDFAEYLPRDAVLFNGMSGDEAHNLYPVLYQKAAFDLLQKKRPGDYLLFVRSGFNGTGGLVPMVWAGDQNTDFDLADGLPAALTGALNAGMSGIPLWGSDISGYHYLFNPPPDKELYLRWTELGAFSADMHDENNGAGPPGAGSSDRWQLWSDQETIDTYRKYASLKTRMLPYVRVAVEQARSRGTPVMRHLYLSYPQDPRVYATADEYMYGDFLLVAPVVAKGETSRPVYLPEPAYYDYWTGARVAGGGTIQAQAPLDSVPVYAKQGALIPLLSPDVETVVPSLDNSVVSAADRADYLEVQVFAGGQSSITLADGTKIFQSAPTSSFTPLKPSYSGGEIPATLNQADLGTCPSCAYTDPATGIVSISIRTAGDTITAGPLTLQVSGAPSPRRYVFTVRH